MGIKRVEIRDEHRARNNNTTVCGKEIEANYVALNKRRKI